MLVAAPFTSTVSRFTVELVRFTAKLRGAWLSIGTLSAALAGANVKERSCPPP
jgi:hypothetical protein